MPGQPSSNPKPTRFINAHMVATSFAAIAGVAIAAYQTLMPGAAPTQQPVQVTLAVESPAAKAEVPVEKGDAVQSGPFDIGQGAQYSAALKDGAEQRYRLAELFDGKSETSLSIAAPDRELNVLVSFAEDMAQPVNLIEYIPPSDNSAAAATQLDVMVLPEGQMDTTGRPIQSFTLQTTPGKQSFAIPGQAMGKGVWLRIAGPANAESIAIGDFRILK
jgi:hypothetical protein